MDKSCLEELRMLGELRAKGVLSEAEFAEQKRAVLRRISESETVPGKPLSDTPRTANNVLSGEQGSLWLSIPPLVFGILAFLSAFDPAPWDEDTIVGFGVFVGYSVLMGTISAVVQQKARAAAIAGVILGLLATVIVLA